MPLGTMGEYAMSKPLLEVHSLSTHFFTEEGVIRAVEDVNFEIFPGEILSLVGESGCGKSVTGLSILRLISSPPGKIVGGQIFFEGRNLLDLGERDMEKVRGNDISMIFQEPMTSLNPVFSIGDQIMEAILLHQKVDRGTARKKAIEMLESSIIDDFNSFVSAKNIDYELVEAILRKGWGVDVCRTYLEKALAFANRTKEDQHVNMLEKMLTAFETEYQAKEVVS